MASVNEEDIPRNVLAERYASPEIVSIWSPRKIILDERDLWIAAMEVSEELGVSTPEGAIESYRRVRDNINFASIAERERKGQHDVVARREEFNALAGFSLAHQALTSRDDTDNLEQLRVLQSLNLVRERSIAVLARLGKRAAEWSTVDICGRSHLMPGQTTTVGKRFATIAEEFLHHFGKLEHLISTYRSRGFKGAMGTMQDLIAHLGSEEKALEFERRMCARLGIPRVFDSVGQIYPRSLDSEVIGALFHLAAPLANLSNLIRLSAGFRYMIEGFSEGRKGSSAMPHKRNPSKSERMKSFFYVLDGHLTMAKRIAGDDWFEGDVSDSLVRRVVFPDAFFAMDGLIETALTVLDQMRIFPEVIAHELAEELPFLSTTRIREMARQRGVDDRIAYETIQEHALAAAEDICRGKPNTLLKRLSGDPRLGLDLEELRALVEKPDYGLAVRQVEEVCEKIRQIVEQHPELASYMPQTRV